MSSYPDCDWLCNGLSIGHLKPLEFHYVSTAPRNSKFEGFCDDNDDIGEIILSSETSDDEISTPAQRSNSHENRRNFIELTEEGESIASYNSTGSGRVIIIEPVADACPNEMFFQTL
jgi:hypothetical protein